MAISAVRMAAGNNRKSVAQMLLEAGADKDLANDDGFTAVFIAFEHGHLEVVRLLLESGADRDLARNDGACVCG